ncbi:MAG: PRC-barrel domain-containing protein [Gammaproteobacteria bacterium]
MAKFQALSAIQNRAIVDSSGEHVGVIHDLLFNARDGKIEYVCIALSPGADRNPSEVIVPWSALRIDADNARWQVAAGKRILRTIAQPLPQRSLRSDSE